MRKKFGRRVRRFCNKSGNDVIFLFLHGGERLFGDKSGVVHTVKVCDQPLRVGAVKKCGLCPIGADGENAYLPRTQLQIDGAGKRKDVRLRRGILCAERNGLEGGDACNVD